MKLQEFCKCAGYKNLYDLCASNDTCNECVDKNCFNPVTIETMKKGS